MTEEIPWKEAKDGDTAVLNIGGTEIRLPVHGYPTGRPYVYMSPKFMLSLNFLNNEMDVLVRVERAQRELPTKIGSVIRTWDITLPREYVRVGDSGDCWVRVSDGSSWPDARILMADRWEEI